MNKICTDLIQSKKLIELGVDVNTADMWYQHIGYSITDGKEKPKYFPMVIRDNISNEDIPAWSLSALLEFVPNGEKNDENYVDTESHSDFYICTYRNCWDGCIHSEYSKENLFDAVFGMICWLKENNKI